MNKLTPRQVLFASPSAHSLPKGGPNFKAGAGDDDSSEPRVTREPYTKALSNDVFHARVETAPGERVEMNSASWDLHFSFPECGRALGFRSKTCRWPRRLLSTLVLAAVFISAVCLISCASADAVATFAGDAAKSLNQGSAVFNDFPASVVRRDCAANVESRGFDIKPADEACVMTSLEQANLTSAKKDRDDILAVQRVLIDYFNALQQLAAFGKATDSSGKSKSDASSGSSSANNLKTSGKLTSSDEVKAITGLGALVVKAFSAGYRDRQLSRDLKDADDAIGKITDALTHIVKDDYEYDPARPELASLLNQEAHRMSEQYKDADGSPMLLRVSWTDRSTKLLARSGSAESYVEALNKIKGGHHKMATQPTQFKARSLAAGLQPDISGLESLIPQISKAF